MTEAYSEDGQVVVLCDNADLTITVISSIGQTESSKYFKVSRDVVKSKSEYFEASLKFKEPHERNIVLQNEHPLAMYVWLMHMHTEKDYGNESAWRGPNGLYSRVDDTVLWHIIRVGDKYLFDGDILKGFFAEWYERNVDMDRMETDFARALALPCFCFDHAVGFAEITKWLAYNCDGHVKEKKPVKFKWEHQHLAPPDFVGPMNHARGGLKTSIHRELWKEVGSLLGRRSCVCGHWEATAGRYFSELVRTGAYPLEENYGKHSTNTILMRLKSFSMTPLRGACSSCTTDWKRVVERAVRCTERYFNGLCLDCMDRSSAKRETADKDYWEHNKSIDGHWDKHCRIKHGEPTWYVSWRGREETRQKLIKSNRKEKAAWVGFDLTP